MVGQNGETGTFGRTRSRRSRGDNQDEEEVSEEQMSLSQTESQSLKRRLSDREEKKMRKEFEDKLNKIAAEIESITPNMKVRRNTNSCTKVMISRYPLTIFLLHLFSRPMKHFLLLPSA